MVSPTCTYSRRAHPFFGAVLLKLCRLDLALLSCLLVLLERVEDVVLVEAGKVAVAGLPAALALGARRGDCAFADV